MKLPEGGDWELVTDCETAGPLSEAVKAAARKDELPVRAHPWLPVGTVLAFNPSKVLPGAVVTGTVVQAPVKRAAR